MVDVRVRLLLNFHYSDTWADPGHQRKPAAWVNLHGADLEKAANDHTKEVMVSLKIQGTAPDMVQIENEISNRMLWPDGKVWKTGEWEGPALFDAKENTKPVIDMYADMAQDYSKSSDSLGANRDQETKS